MTLVDEADLDWYDYGFRNYDPQIGRFPQLDPLTWDYPELTNYQYAGNEPIANVDLDGLEPLPTVTVTTYISKTASQGANLTSLGLRATLTAANTGFRIGLDGQKNLSATDMERRDSFFHQTNSEGTIALGGQENLRDGGGIPFTSKDGQGGGPHATHGDKEFVSIDGILEMFWMVEKAKPFSLKPDFTDAWDAVKLFGKVTKLIGKDATKSKAVNPTKNDRTRIDPMFNKKGNIIYHRDKGYKTVANGDGTQTLAPYKRATDTFPKQKLIPFYSYPK